MSLEDYDFDADEPSSPPSDDPHTKNAARNESIEAIDAANTLDSLRLLGTLALFVGIVYVLF